MRPHLFFIVYDLMMDVGISDVKAQEHTATAQDRVEGVVEAVLRSCEDLAQLQVRIDFLLLFLIGY